MHQNAFGGRAPLGSLQHSPRLTNSIKEEGSRKKKGEGGGRKREGEEKGRTLAMSEVR